jgi:hypothetical protein
MPTKVGIHGFIRLFRGIVVDGGPSPAMTRYVSVLAGWCDMEREDRLTPSRPGYPPSEEEDDR